jgi:RND family efflux transporter MFP subunit
VQRSVTVFGTLFGDEEATISNKVLGRVRRVAADVGDVVSSGAVLCQLELEDYELAHTAAVRALEAVLAKLAVTQVPGDGFDPDRVATVERARAQLENAKARFARLQGLEKKGEGFVADQTLKDAETDVSVAAATLDAERLNIQALVAEARQRKAEVAIAERKLSDATIRAPEGTRSWAVAARLVSEGEYLKEGTAVYRVLASDPLKLRAAVPERYTSELRVGLDARVRVEAWGERAFLGKISRMNPSVDVQSRTFGIEILVPNPTGDLRPGSFARAEVFTRREDAVLVPLESIVSFAGVTKLFRVDGDRAHEVVVEQRERQGDLVEVLGIAPDVPVVTRGQTVLADGLAVVVSGTAAGEARAAK